MNLAIVAGNLGQDPELHETSNGHVTNFSVATSDYKGDTTWHNIVAFNKTAESCCTYLKKGSKVIVNGRIQNRSWEDGEGNTRYKTEIVANNVEFINTKSASDGDEDIDF